MKLVIMRHGQSLWNMTNQFTGWSDVELSDNGVAEAVKAGNNLKLNNFDFDICYTSYLKRAIKTLNIVLEQMDKQWLNVIKDWHLNERHYGALQGLNKDETKKQYGEEQVFIWRRSYNVAPPKLDESDLRNPAKDVKYKTVSPSDLPLGESLEDTYNRVIPFFLSEIKPKLEMDKNILIVAHGNSLRALVKYLEKLSDEEITKVNIPTGVPLVYELDEKLNVISKKYIK